jgi:hypothetical protein
LRLIQEHEYPPEFAARKKASEEAIIEPWRRGDFAAAAALTEAAYRLLADSQPEGRRFHKGWSLHQLGLFRMLLGDARVALEATFLAFAEDAMSLAEERPDRLLELTRPAAHNLVYVFAIPGPQLAACGRQIRTQVDEDQIFSNPSDLLRVEAVARVLDLAPAKTGLRIPGIFNSRPEDRVWIGGSYKDGRLEGVLRPIRDDVDRLGYDGVIAADFSIPEQMGVDEHALMLMNSCRRAVFDITVGRGQTDEIAALPDTLRPRTLAVYDARVEGAPDVSKGMTLEKLARWGIEPRPFLSDEELLSLLTSWLRTGYGPA